MAKSKKIIDIKKKVKNKVEESKTKFMKKTTGGKIKDLIFILLMILGIAFISIVIVFFLYIVITAPTFKEDLLYNKEATTLLDKNGNEIARLGAENRELVSYDDLPEVLVDAIVSVEDSRFFQHNGFDIARFTKASLGQLAGNSGAGGASTLTMQVSKNTFTSTEASGIQGIIRKFTDIYISVFKLEKTYTKEEIIEFYVNSPFLGCGTYGVEQASEKYFGKSVSDLTLAEASLLAGIFNAPTSYNPFNSVELATKRRSVVLNLMVQHGYITEEQKEEAESISVASLLTTNRSTGINKYQSFIDTVVEEVIDRTGNDPYSTSMNIQTTLDPDVQDILNGLNDGTLGYKWVNDVVQVGIAITNTQDGSITAVDGGRFQDTERAYNRATSKMFNRHPGSTAKPIFDYGPYIEYENGSPYSPFFDEKMTYSNGTELKNSDGSYLGMISMRTALVKSRNIPAVQAFQQTDKEDIANFAHSLGIDYGDELYESTAIGGFNGVNPLQMSAAYAAFGRGGYYIEPYSFTKITYNDTNEEVEFKYEPVQVMSEETAYLINDMLMSATKAGVGGSLKVSGTDMCSKSGTSTYDSAALKKYNVPSSASMDNWMNVYSPDYSISIWYGYDELNSEYYTTSLQGAAQRKKISAAVCNKVFIKNSRFSKPSGIVEAKVELETFPAQSPSDYTPQDLITTELFKKGTEPSEVSTRFSQLSNPTNGNATNNGNSVILSWDGIDTPDAISETYLQTFFNENYGQFATKYYGNRINYNNSSIGTIGYQVYQNINGTLSSLGYTTDTKYTTTCVGTCTYVIKSSYSIFKSNMSSGLTIETSNGTSSTDTPTNTTGLVATPSSDTTFAHDNEVDARTEDKGYITVTYNGTKVTDASIVKEVTFNGTKVTIENNMYNIHTVGTYVITYKVTYNGESTTTTRKIIVT